MQLPMSSFHGPARRGRALVGLLDLAMILPDQSALALGKNSRWPLTSESPMAL